MPDFSGTGSPSRTCGVPRRPHFSSPGRGRWAGGLVPTAATVVAAAILKRDPGEDGSVVPGTLRMEHCWLIPRDTGDDRVEELLRRIDDEGMRVIDPREAERRATPA